MVAYRNDHDEYSPGAVLSRIFTGGNVAERNECRRELAALGDGPAGDRLRSLFEKLLTLQQDLQDAGWVHRGHLVRRDGTPLTVEEIAAFIIWDLDCIEDDLRELARVGLLGYIPEGALP